MPPLWALGFRFSRRAAGGPARFRRNRLFFCAGVWLATAVAFASPQSASAAATAWVGDDHAAVRLIAAVEATGSGSTVDAGLEIRLMPGWHTYWRSPGDAGIPPSIEWAGSTNLDHAEIAWPAPVRLSLQGFETAGYAGHLVLPIAVTLARPGEPLKLNAAVSYAACSEICVPYSANLTLALPAGLASPGPQAPLIAEARARVPGSLEAAGLTLLSATVGSAPSGAVLDVRLRARDGPFRAPELFVEGLSKGSPGRPTVEIAELGHVARLSVPLRGADMASVVGRPLTLTVVDGAAAEFTALPVAGAASDDARPLLSILAIALLGGLILNAMPCVLPVLSLKLLAVASQAGVDRRRLRVGLLMTAGGVLASFAAIAAVLIALKASGAAIGWGIQFQWPWFVAGMAALTTLFAASLWGWLPIALPGAAYDAAVFRHARRPNAEAFLTGAFATLLATPCSAPFVGTAIGFALAEGPRQIAMIFAAMGLGFAAPYLAAAAAPRLVGLLPKPGPWLNKLRAVLGLALAGTAIWLLFVLAALSGRPVALMTGAALLAVLALLVLKSLRRTPRSMARIASLAAAAMVTASVLWPAFAGIDRSTPAEAAGRWRRFDPGELHRLVDQGKVVLVDVTGGVVFDLQAKPRSRARSRPGRRPAVRLERRGDARRLDAPRSRGDRLSAKFPPIWRAVRCGLRTAPSQWHAVAGTPDRRRGHGGVRSGGGFGGRRKMIRVRRRRQRRVRTR